MVNRRQFGKRLADFQALQFMLADCASELYIGRLMLLHIAYKAEKGLDIRQENSIAKIFHAHMVHKVIDTAIQLHGALGVTRGKGCDLGPLDLVEDRIDDGAGLLSWSGHGQLFPGGTERAPAASFLKPPGRWVETIP